MTTITTLEALEALYGAPSEPALVKEADHVTAHYRALIAASPFVALATSGPEGLDCSPRGELGGVVRIHDERTLMMPDRAGNNRTDSLRNVVRDPRVALLFLIPGSGTTLRVNGRAEVSIDPDLLSSFAVDGRLPRSVLVVRIDAIYFQCARAIVRSDLWNADRHVTSDAVPSAGEMLAALSAARVGGVAYDREWPDRARKTLW